MDSEALRGWLERQVLHTYQGCSTRTPAHGLIKGGAVDLQLLQVPIRYPDVSRQGQTLVQILQQTVLKREGTSRIQNFLKHLLTSVVLLFKTEAFTQ